MNIFGGNMKLWIFLGSSQNWTVFNLFIYFFFFGGGGGGHFYSF